MAPATAGRDNRLMNVRCQAVEAAFAQPLTEELMNASGIRAGMHVLVLGRRLTELALQIAERVGPHGRVLAVHEDPHAVAEAQRRAYIEGFEHVRFHAQPFWRITLDEPVDAVFGRFALTHEHDPVAAIRRLSQFAHPGGRIAFQEWHYESVRWKETSGWPHVPLYDTFARWSVEGLRRQHIHVDMGLRLVNAFTEAGLPVPQVRTDLRIVSGTTSLDYAFFESALRDVLPTIDGLVQASEIAVDTFAQRLARQTVAVGGHIFLPLQVGAWSRAL